MKVPPFNLLCGILAASCAISQEIPQTTVVAWLMPQTNEVSCYIAGHGMSLAGFNQVLKANGPSNVDPLVLCVAPGVGTNETHEFMRVIEANAVTNVLIIRNRRPDRTKGPLWISEDDLKREMQD